MHKKEAPLSMERHYASRRRTFPKVVRVNSEDEVLARANNLLVGRAACETAVRLYQEDVIHYRDGGGLLRGVSRSRVAVEQERRRQRLRVQALAAEIGRAKVEAWRRWF
jgi:hypothetical protein